MLSEEPDTASNTVTEPEAVNQHSPSPQTSPPTSPTISQVPEQKLAASEEGTGVNDAEQSIVTTDISFDQASIISNGSVAEIAQADRRQSGENPIHTDKPQSELSFSDGIETLQERLKLMEQQFAGQ